MGHAEARVTSCALDYSETRTYEFTGMEGVGTFL